MITSEKSQLRSFKVAQGKFRNSFMRVRRAAQKTKCKIKTTINVITKTFRKEICNGHRCK